MWDFSFRRAIGLMMQTLPFVLLRMAVYFGAALAYVLVTGTGAGIGWGIGAMGDDGFRASATFFGGLTGFGIVLIVMYWLREYILYMVKAGHIAVMVELIDNRPMPQGRSQIGHAQAMVRERFGEASVLFVIDQLIKGVLRAITGLIRGVFTLLPIPGVRQLITILRAFLRVAVGFIDEVILAYGMRTRSTDPYASARAALVLYAQNYKPMLKNAAWITLFVYGLMAVLFFVMLAPAALISNLYPGGMSAMGVVIAFILAWSVKQAVLEPLAVACLLQAYFRTIEGQVPNPEWDAKLDGMSGKFQKLKSRIGPESRAVAE
ncbi:MAG: hypothetical protein EA338_04945 [Roseinatronobacter sp.]|uniref:Uncharacterized protein n=1 Tax=Roseinatronobacter monicus TaxID=393481 RepID=A0A543KC67_9RHOB|nr:hypothetical protein [Roseinatronobacter monicus]TQM92680.1 hypothetical protein BD293_1295 [Roseinatronobacter monicus]TVQ00672.1 MAG: hypothetical protein EA338_04945 [Roseinatronobacter sp.]